MKHCKDCIFDVCMFEKYISDKFTVRKRLKLLREFLIEAKLYMYYIVLKEYKTE